MPHEWFAGSCLFQLKNVKDTKQTSTKEKSVRKSNKTSKNVPKKPKKILVLRRSHHCSGTRPPRSGSCGPNRSRDIAPTWISLSCGRLCTEFDLRCQGHVLKLVSYFVMSSCTNDQQTINKLSTNKLLKQRRWRKFQKWETYRTLLLLWCMDGRANPLMDRKVVEVLISLSLSLGSLSISACISICLSVFLSVFLSFHLLLRKPRRIALFWIDR